MTQFSSRRHSRRRFIALGASACAAGFLVACMGGTSANGLEMKGRPKIGKRPPPGVLRLGRVAGANTPPTPNAAGASNFIDADDILLAYARLVGVDPRGPAVYHDAAESVEQPEPQLVRFTLREGQQYHRDAAGVVQPISSDSVRNDFLRRASEGNTLFTEVVDRIDRPDSRTVVLHLKAPFGLLFELLAAPSASLRGDGMYAGSSDRVGSGTWVPSKGDRATMQFAANPALSGDLRPLLSRVEVRTAGAADELDAAFSRGEIDLRLRSQPPAQTPGVTEQKRPARRMRGLGLSLIGQKNGATVRSIAAFQDARVRRAVAMSLDRDAILALDGSYTSGPVGPAHAGDALSDGDLRAHPIYRHDADEARKLLTAAGANGLQFRIALPDLPVMQQLGQIVAANLQDAGFQPRLQAVPFDGWQRSFLAGDFESTLFEIGALDTPDIGLRLHTTEGIAGKFSLWGYSNPAYDVAVRAALSAFDPKVRAEQSRAAQRLLLDDGPAMLPLGATPEFASIAPGISGYDFNAYDMNVGYLSTGWIAPQRA